jgi:hypothetical protein
MANLQAENAALLKCLSLMQEELMRAECQINLIVNMLLREQLL